MVRLQLTIGLSKTHGGKTGENLVFSESEEEMEHAVLTAMSLLLWFLSKLYKLV